VIGCRAQGRGRWQKASGQGAPDPHQSDPHRQPARKDGAASVMMRPPPGHGVIAGVRFARSLSSPHQNVRPSAWAAKHPSTTPRRQSTPCRCWRTHRGDRQRAGQSPSDNLLLSPLDEHFSLKTLNPRSAPAAGKLRKGPRHRPPVSGASCGFGQCAAEIPLRAVRTRARF